MLEIYRLKCPSCGAPLELNSDVESFVCSHCGSNAVLRREGGALWAELEQSSRATQEASERIAAELALPRLKQERDAIWHEITEWSKVVEKPVQPKRPSRLWFLELLPPFGGGAAIDSVLIRRKLDVALYELALSQYERDLTSYESYIAETPARQTRIAELREKHARILKEIRAAEEIASRPLNAMSGRRGPRFY